ncbi:MAG: GH25 family lysozyme [Candidatus Saccharibacteria bacterium]|nr:GH25 family lysozyme [Candidatus Saccharibacteria bacterium]
MKRLLKSFFAVVIVVVLAFFIYNAVKTRQLNINQWFANGQILGVDISLYQEDVDMEKLASQGVQFVYIKATEGSKYVDKDFQKNWENALRAEIPAGAYHYFSYKESGLAQAAHFIETIGDLEGRLIPAIDMELTPKEAEDPPKKEDVVKSLRAMVAALEEEYGVKPMIYAQKDYYDLYLAEDFKDYPRWVRNVYYPVFLDAGDAWSVWQYNDRGILEGYSGEKYIDLNIVNSTKGLEALRFR